MDSYMSSHDDASWSFNSQTKMLHRLPFPHPRIGGSEAISQLPN